MLSLAQILRGGHQVVYTGQGVLPTMLHQSKGLFPDEEICRYGVCFLTAVLMFLYFSGYAIDPVPQFLEKTYPYRSCILLSFLHFRGYFLISISSELFYMAVKYSN